MKQTLYSSAFVSIDRIPPADTSDETNHVKLVRLIVTESGKQPFGSVIYHFIQLMSGAEKSNAINRFNDRGMDFRNDTLADGITGWAALVHN